MLARQMLAGLRRVIEAGGDETRALADLRTVDPLLRPLARARLRRAIRLELTHLEDDGLEGVDDDRSGRSVLRRVYLRLGGWPVAPDAHPGEVALQYARLVGEHSRGVARGWWLTGALGVAVVCGAVGGLGHGLRASGAATPLARVPPPPAGAYALGGEPCRDVPRVRAALGHHLVDWVLAMDALGTTGLADRAALRRRLARTRRAVLSPSAREVFGHRLSVALAALMRRGEGVATSRHPGLASARFLEAVVAVNESLAARNLGFYLDGDVLESVSRRRVVVSAFEVERVSHYRSRGEVDRVLFLRRLDRLNIRHHLLGFTRPAHHEALVLVDEVESVLLRDLLPAVADQELPLLDDATAARAPRWARFVSRRAGEVVRAELSAVPGVTSGQVTELAGLLLQRRRLVRRWQGRLASRGIVVTQPERLGYQRSDRDLLARLVPTPELLHFDHLQQRLLDPQAKRTLRTLGAALAASVARHEVQHRLDYRRRFRGELPAPYARLVGPARDRRGRRRVHHRRVLNELSAYLAELARDTRTLRTNLSLLARYVLDLDYRGRPEVQAVRVLLEGLDNLISPGHPGARLAPRVRAIDRADLAARYLRLVAAPPALLRQMAARLWRRLFGATLPAVVRSAASPSPWSRPGRCPDPGVLPPEADGPRPGPPPPFGGLSPNTDRSLIPKVLRAPASRS